MDLQYLSHLSINLSWVLSLPKHALLIKSSESIYSNPGLLSLEDRVPKTSLALPSSLGNPLSIISSRTGFIYLSSMNFLRVGNRTLALGPVWSNQLYRGSKREENGNEKNIKADRRQIVRCHGWER